LPFWLGSYATVQRQGPDAALATVKEGLEAVKATGERRYEAELYRLRGNFARLAPRGDDEGAEKDFQKAMRIAAREGAKLLELRAAASLARLWRDRGKRTQARDLLAPVYGWFTEGFDTADLKEAKALLDQLA